MPKGKLYYKDFYTKKTFNVTMCKIEPLPVGIYPSEFERLNNGILSTIALCAAVWHDVALLSFRDGMCRRAFGSVVVYKYDSYKQRGKGLASIF